MLVDTSVWLAVLRDASGRAPLEAALAGAAPVFSRFTQLELLAGCKGERDWDLLAGYLAAQDYLELGDESWPHATRMLFDLRRRRKEVSSAISCCIAQLAIENDLLLLHSDPDFETIAEVRNLRQRRLELGGEKARPRRSRTR
jgi:predicted nucleic acid-binding protein